MTAGQLQLGTSISGRLKGGERHSYELPLPAGHYAEVVLEQQGIDVALKLLDPRGNTATESDHPTGPDGLERVMAIAQEVDASYRVEVCSLDPGVAPGAYRLWIGHLRPATERDHQGLAGRQVFARSEVLRRQGTTEARRQAIGQYREALKIFRATEDLRSQAETLHRLGGVYRDLGENAAARDAYREAVPLFRLLEDRLWEGLVLSQLSAVELLAKNSSAALQVAEEAWQALRNVDNPARQATALNTLGNVRQRVGEVQLALDAYTEARDLARQGGNVTEEANALFGKGLLLTYQGKLSSALDNLEQALALYEQSESERNAAGARNRIAAIYYRRGELEKAGAVFEEVLAVRRRTGDRRGEAITLSSLGTVQLQMGRLPEALASYHRALELYRKSQDRNGEAGALANLGRFFQQQGDFRKALGYHLAASEVFEQTRSERDRVSSLYNIALAHHSLGANEEAEDSLERVFEQVEVLRAKTPRIDLREEYMASKQHYFDLYVQVLMHLHEEDPAAGFDQRALEIHERRRSRALLDLLRTSGVDLRARVEPDLLEREQALQAELLAMEQALDAEPPRSAERRDLEIEQRRLLGELATVRGRMHIRDPRFVERSGQHTLSFGEIQRRGLDATSDLLVYSLGDKTSTLWWVSGSGAMSSHVLPPRAVLEDLAEEVLEAWSSLASWRRRKGLERSMELSRLLLGPIEQHLKHQRLVIIADGALQALPFTALPLPGEDNIDQRPRRLIENHEVVHLPSMSSLMALREGLRDRPLAPLRLAVIADPVFSPEDSRFDTGGEGSRSAEESDPLRSLTTLGITEPERLPHTEEEALSILKLVPEGQRLGAQGFDATRELVLSGELRRYRVLHMATHGLLNDTQPELSGLMFSLLDRNGRPIPGFVPVHEIYGLELWAELVVLSACRTGSGKKVRGEGLVGMTQGFFHAGSPRLVVSLWDVSDESTSQLMRRFYRHIFGDPAERGTARLLLPSAALRAAQLSMLREEDFSHPYHWAGFIFQGDWQGKAGAGDLPLEPAETSAPPDEHDHDMPLPGTEYPSDGRGGGQ